MHGGHVQHWVQSITGREVSKGKYSVCMEWVHIGGRERSRWSGCVGCMAEGAVDQGQGPIILVHGIRADMSCFQVAPLLVILVHTTANSATFSDTPVPYCAMVV